MPRRPRNTPGGYVYHVLNRSVARMKMFRAEKDFTAFEKLIAEAHERHPIRILAYCVMPTHWHFVVWPKRDDQVTAFFRWLAHTHAMRWRASHRTVGYGPLYQGRFKAFPVQPDGPSLRSVCRYVERNALTAGLVRRAEAWRWGSLYVREQGSEPQRELLSEWPEPIPSGWRQRVNAPLTGREKELMKKCLERSQPFGEEAWIARTVAKLGLEHTLRREGRPEKPKGSKERK